MTVVDASVVIKWFVDEPDSASARKILASSDRLSAPAHLLAEVGRGLLRSKRAGNIASSDAVRVLSGVPEIVALASMEDLAPLAFEIADRSSVTIYDALYVALAERIDGVVVTADQRLCEGLARSDWAGRARHLREHNALPDAEPDL